jgi:hypothetical protein
MLRLKLLMALLVLPLLIVFFSANVHKVSAFNLFNRACNGDNVQGGNKNSSSVCKASNESKGSGQNNNVVLHTLNVIINIVATVAGVAAVLVIVIAGFTYTTAGGSADETKNARNRIIYAAVGLVIIMFSWTITHFILTEVL